MRAAAQHLLADAEHRLLLRRPRDPPEQEGRHKIGPDRLPLDAAVVPGLLLLVARDLLAYDPPRVLAWRLLHDPRLAIPSWLLPAPPPEIDRDPIALVLGAFAVALALAYFVACLGAARPALRGALLGAGAVVLVAAPTLAFIAMGAATGRPYGQDGGVVQLPLAIDKILDGESPYRADYSATILGRQARVSDFWSERGGNPILHHHAYLPGTHLLMLPFYLLGRAAGLFDPRFVTLLALVLAAVLASRLVQSPERRLAAAAVVLLNPLVYWQQIFGANDVLIVALLLVAVTLAEAGRPLAAAAVLGLACATKQLAWPFAPFLFLYLSGAGSWRDLAGPARRRLLTAIVVAAAVFGAVVLPVAALDFRAFWADIVVYNVGLPGGDNYPLGARPGSGSRICSSTSAGWPACATTSRSHPSTCCWFPSASCSRASSSGSGWRPPRSRRWNGAAALVVLLARRASQLPDPGRDPAARRAPDARPRFRRRGGRAPPAPGRRRGSHAGRRVPGRLERRGGSAAPRAPRGTVAGPRPARRGRADAGPAGPPAERDRGRPRDLLVDGRRPARERVLSVGGRRPGHDRGGDRADDRRHPGGGSVRCLSGPGSMAVSLRPETAPGSVQEAWSTSFRRDPPATLESGYGGPLREPRRITLAMIPILAALVFALVVPAHRPIALGLALLAPPIVVGTLFGSGALVVLTALAVASWCAARGLTLAAAIAGIVALLAAAPGMAVYADGGWVNLALFCAGTGAGLWLAGVIWAAVRGRTTAMAEHEHRYEHGREV